MKLERPQQYVPGPDVCGDYILNSDEDPCYENVAALGPELIGWTLVANEEAAPERSLYPRSGRQIPPNGGRRADGLGSRSTGRQFDPRRFLPSEYLYEYVPGYSKRTLLGGFLPAADIGVWNPRFQVGYEVMVILPDGADARPLGRVRALLPKDSERQTHPRRGHRTPARPHPRVGIRGALLEWLGGGFLLRARGNLEPLAQLFRMPACRWRFPTNG